MDQLGLAAHRTPIGTGHPVESGGLDQVRIGIADIETVEGPTTE